MDGTCANPMYGKPLNRDDGVYTVTQHNQRAEVWRPHRGRVIEKMRPIVEHDRRARERIDRIYR